MEIKDELAAIITPRDPNYALTSLGGVEVFLRDYNEKKRESYFKRSKALLKTLDKVPFERWWINIGEQLSQIGKMVNDAILSLYPNGATEQYVDSVVFEVAGYQLKNVKKICEYVVRTYDGSKALPNISFWISCITKVKTMAVEKSTAHVNDMPKISESEQVKVKEMIRDLCKSLG